MTLKGLRKHHSPITQISMLQVDSSVLIVRELHFVLFLAPLDLPY